MERSAITDYYIFPQRKLELIWLVTHMLGCQFQHTTPDTTPRRAQLAAALPARCRGPRGPSLERRGRAATEPTGSRVAGGRSERAGCARTCVCTETCASALTPGMDKCARARTHTRTCTLGTPQRHSGLGYAVDHSVVSSANQSWGKSN